MLEYQSGIVFLTSNRVDDFDTALFSRVHITLKFTGLTVPHCRFIWVKMSEQTDHDLTESDFDRLSQIPMDGRTIKNILRVASLQAKMRFRTDERASSRLGMDDIKTVLRYTIGDSKDEKVTRKVDEFYNS